MEADKILVMDAGNVVEFAPPTALLTRPNGYFTQLLKQTGEESFRKLKSIAEAKAARIHTGNEIDPFEDPDNVIFDQATGVDIIKQRMQSGGNHMVNSKHHKLNHRIQTIRENENF